MCTAIFAFGVHTSLAFLLAFNRDEYFERQTQMLSDWEDFADIIGPRDLVRYGTWVGITKKGRVSFLTNFLQSERKRIDRSRGDLPVLFLTGTERPLQFLEGLDLEGYGTVNLITAQVDEQPEVAFRSSATDEPAELLPPGVHGFSNGTKDDTKWEKVEAGKQKMEQLMTELEDGEELPWDEIFDDILGSTTETELADNLPKTGLSEEFERRISAMKILPFYIPQGDHVGSRGTTSQIVIAVWKDGLVEMKERALEEDGEFLEQECQFHMGLESPQ